MKCKKCNSEKEKSDFNPIAALQNSNYGVCKACCSDMYRDAKDAIKKMRKEESKLLETFVGGKVLCDRCGEFKDQKDFPACSLANRVVDAGFGCSCTACNTQKTRINRKKRKEKLILIELLGD